MTFKTLKINYNLYLEKVLPYINNNLVTGPAKLPDSNLYILKKGIINTGLDLENLQNEMMIISINPSIKNNNETIGDLEKLTGEKFN